jgi:hypothetical protein
MSPITSIDNATPAPSHPQGRSDIKKTNALDIPLNPTASNAPSIPLPPAPNGGFKAWTQPVAAHLVIINCWGYISSFGFFQSFLSGGTFSFGLV